MLLAYSWMFSEISSPNERSRVYLTVALVDYGTVAIDAPANRFGPVADVSFFEGRLYTDKAPGSSFLGAVVYGAARLFALPRDFTISELVNLMRTWLMLPTAVLGFVLLRSLLRRLGTTESGVDVASLSFALGTAYFHYSAAFFGHALVAVMLLGALFLLPGEHSRRRSPWLFGAGAMAGMAGFTEYQAIVAAALLFLFVLFRERRRPASVLAFALGAAPFAIGLLAYNEAAFGGPFELSYQHLASSGVQARHLRGIAGVGEPTAQATIGSLLSPHRGLVTTSPIVVLFPVGIVALARRREVPVAVLVLAQVGYFLAFVFGADMWFGGWGFGPRLLVPCLGVLFLAVGPAVDLVSRSSVLSGIVRGLSIWGVVYFAAVTEVFPELPPEIVNPLADVVRPALERGQHAPNLLTRAGAEFGVATLYPAWALTAIACLVIAARGLSKVRSIPGRGLSLALALALPAALPLASAKVFERFGPTQGENAQRGFLEFMEALERREPRGA